MPWEGVSIPKDPANYDPDNKYADPVAYFQHREAKTAEEFVKVAEAKVCRQQWHPLASSHRLCCIALTGGCFLTACS